MQKNLDDDKPWLDDPEYMAIVGEFLKRPELKKLNKIEHHHISTRLQHSLRVSYQSYKITKKLGWKSYETARAGLFHDMFYYDWRETKFAKSHAYVHPRIAYRNAKKLTEISPLEKDIIIKHMWGATLNPPRYKESFLVSFVDDAVAIKEWRASRRAKRQVRKQQLKHLRMNMQHGHN
ncbi:HD domain-containing protein [Lactovum odontotermitis]